MNKSIYKVVIIILITSVLILGIISLKYNRGITKQENEIEELQTQVEELQDKNDELLDSLEQLHNKIADIIKSSESSYNSLNGLYNSLEDLYTEKDLQVSSTPSYPSHLSNIPPNEIAYIAYKSGNCEYFILKNNSGYILAEWMGENEPDGEDIVVGNFNSYGTREFFNKSDDMNSRLYIEDFNLTKQEAYDKLSQKCR